MTRKSFWHRNKWIEAGAVVCFVLLMGALLFPVFVQKGDGKNPCLSNIKQCAVAILMYSSDHDGRLPPADAWMDCASKYAVSLEVFACPDVRRDDPRGYGYAMNITLSAKAANQVRDPGNTALVFDSELLARNACSGFYGLPDPPRLHGNCVAFLDGHARTRFTPERAAAYGPDGVLKPANTARRMRPRS